MKKKKIVITLVVILVILLITVLTLGICSWFFTGLFDTVKPANKEFQKQLGRVLNTEGAKVSDYSDFLDDYKEVYNKPVEGKFEIEADLSISELDEDVQDTINKCKLTMESKADPQNENAQSVITLNADDEKVLSLDVVTNGTKVGIGSDDIYDKYLAVSLEDLQEYIDKNTSKSAKTPGVSLASMKPAKIDAYQLLYISKDDLKHFDKEYKNVLSELISKDAFTSKQTKVDVDGKSVGANGFYLTLTGKDAYEFINGFTEKLENDDVVVRLITEKANLILESMGQDKISEDDTKEMLKELTKQVSSLDDLKNQDNIGIQIAVYTSKFVRKPLKLEVNYINDMDDIYSGETLFSIEYAKNKNIYTFNMDEKKNVTIVDNYEKNSKDHKKGSLSVSYSGFQLATVDYEFLSKKSESKIAINAKLNEMIAEGSLNIEVSTNGDYRKEPVEINANFDVKYQEESAKLKVSGTTEFKDSVDIPTLSDDNSVNVLKLSSSESEKLGNELLEKASKVLPERLKLIGVNIKAEDILPKKSTTTNTKTAPAAPATISEKSTDKVLVATKKASDSTFGEYNQTLQITFEDDKASKIDVILELKDDSMIKTYATALQSASKSNSQFDGVTISTQDNKLIMSMEASKFLSEEDIDTDSLTRDAVKTALEEDGYTIK